VVVRSSTEVEYRFMVIASCEVFWLLQLFEDLGVKKLVPITLKCDNQATLHIAATLVFHERTKHIEMDCHFVRDQLKAGVIKTSYVPSKQQLVDLLTKIVPLNQHQKLLSKLGVSCLC